MVSRGGPYRHGGMHGDNEATAPFDGELGNPLTVRGVYDADCESQEEGESIFFPFNVFATPTEV